MAVRIHEGPFDPWRALAAFAARAGPRDGAVASFVGRVRADPVPPAPGPGEEPEGPKESNAPAPSANEPTASKAPPQGAPQAVAVHLEHHPEMALEALEALEARARRRWPISDALLEHRVGRAPVGEPLVLVAASAPRRADALAACAFLIDRLKVEVPFWKREEDASGAMRWVGARESDRLRAEAWGEDD